MNRYEKRDLPVEKVRRFLEPGPIVLVSSKWRGATNIMTMGWHMVMGSRALAQRLLHLGRKPQLRDASKKQGVRHQHSDRRHRGEGRGNR